MSCRWFCQVTDLIGSSAIVAVIDCDTHCPTIVMISGASGRGAVVWFVYVGMCGGGIPHLFTLKLK